MDNEYEEHCDESPNKSFIKAMEEILNSDEQEKDSFWYENLQMRIANQN